MTEWKDSSAYVQTFHARANRDMEIFMDEGRFCPETFMDEHSMDEIVYISGAKKSSQGQNFHFHAWKFIFPCMKCSCHDLSCVKLFVEDVGSNCFQESVVS